jgi:hypothetical protein
MRKGQADMQGFKDKEDEVVARRMRTLEKTLVDLAQD